ncbi:MAG: hypothetical protein AAF787_00185 [Chloroflexota bacterium]
MVTNANTLNRLVDDLLDRGYDTATRTLIDALSRSVSGGRVARRLGELDNEVVRLTLEGERLQPDNPVLVALLGDLESELREAATAMRRQSSDLQARAAVASERLTRELALPGLSNAQLVSIGIQWNTPDAEAVNALIGYVGSFQWDAELARFPGLIVGTVRNQAIRGIVSGWSPERAAREIRRVTQGLAPAQANNLMRTLYLQSYRRGAAIHQQANADILEGQIRVGVLDNRTCLACIALHGTRLPVGEVVVDHHQGRCTSIPIVRGRRRNIQTGEQWFNNLSPAEKQNMAAFRRSPGKLEALNSGRATLQDFVVRYEDSVFGEMVREGSLRNALGGASPPRRRGPRGGNSPGQIVTGEGYRADDRNAFNGINDRASLTAFVLDDGLRAADMWRTGALGFGADGEVSIDNAVLREYVKRYVRESRSSYESRDALRTIMQSYLQDSYDISLSLEEADGVINADEARRAEALLKLAEVSGLRLTDAQQRRLNRARSGEYLDMTFEEVGEAGTFLNEMARARDRRSGVRRDSAEYRRMKDDFDRQMGRGDYLEGPALAEMQQQARDRRRGVR